VYREDGETISTARSTSAAMIGEFRQAADTSRTTTASGRSSLRVLILTDISPDAHQPSGWLALR
jgi:hypothetical protein